MESNGIFIKQIFIPSSDTLTKVSNFLVSKTTVIPNIFWKMERDQHNCYIKMGTQLRNVFREFFISDYVDVGSVCLFVRGPTPSVKQPERSEVSYWFVYSIFGKKTNSYLMSNVMTRSKSGFGSVKIKIAVCHVSRNN